MSNLVQTQIKASPKPSITPTSAGLLQRACACGGTLSVDGECEECRKKRLSRQPNAAPATSSQAAPTIVNDVLHSAGHPLDARARTFMEPRFGHDFSNVRVHTDARAAESVRAVNALAYTVGRDMVFGTGQYAPGTQAGMKLMAHELTHVVQQGNKTFNTGSAIKLGSLEDTHEQMADRAANTTVADHPARLTIHDGEISHPIIQRQPLTKRNHIGCPVPELQDALNATGESLDVDGRFGVLTDAAVHHFQQTHPPLVPDGDVGNLTWATLHAAAPGKHGRPTGEITNPIGWGSGLAETMHFWQQQLTPDTTNFSGCKVTEADTRGGTDTCWFPGSDIRPVTAITGGTWDVKENNFWGDDGVGWFTNAVTYYRAQGKAPCQFSFPQSMRVVRPDGNLEYQHNQLAAVIGKRTVSSTRAGQTVTRTWP